MFIVIELQTSHTGECANIVNAYEAKALADEKYHRILASASVSEVDYHSTVILNDKSGFIKSEYIYLCTHISLTTAPEFNPVYAFCKRYVPLILP